MDPFPPPIRRCIEELEKLPGIGRRSAQRIVFHLLSKGPGASEPLGRALSDLATAVDRCPECRTYREAGGPCPFCSDPGRDGATLCVVESVVDAFLVEHTGEFRGVYHVLHGLLSPLRGVTPEALGLDALAPRIAGGLVREVILATPPTAEGEATASYIAQGLRGRDVRLSRIGFGVPVGADLQYADAQTLARSLSGRRDYS
jgi:recombination protein RecR